MSPYGHMVWGRMRLTLSISFKFDLFLSGPLNVSHTKQPKPHISVEHLVAVFNLAVSIFSGGSYISKEGGTLIGGIGVPSTFDTYSKPPNFHSPDPFTKTDQTDTLLWRRFPSLFKNDNALCEEWK